MLTCTSCTERLERPRRRCPVCKKKTGCPSYLVYAEEDRESLDQRVRDRQKSLDSRSWTKLDNLRRRIKKAMRVAINMRLESLLNLLSDPRIAYTNLHGNQLAGAVVSDDPDTRYNIYNKRRALDLLLFGPDGEEVRFGALSLGGPGLFSYGAASILLKEEEALNCRISFLEENSFFYYQNDPPGVSVKVSEGVRALWPDAPMLAVLKHEMDLVKRRSWAHEQLRDLILFCEGNRRTDRFIEAQIAPPLTLENIEKIIVYSPAAYINHGTGTEIEGEMAELSRNLVVTLCSSAESRGIIVEAISDSRTGGMASVRR